MKLIPMKEMLKKTKDEINVALAPIRAIKIKAKAETAKANLAEEIINLNTEVQELCTSKEIDFHKLGDLIDEIELKEHRQTRINEIVAQLFPDGTEAEVEPTAVKE